MVSRIVHQNIHGSVFRGDSVHQLLRLLRVRNIEPVIMYPVAEFFQGFRYFFRFTAGCNTYNSPCTDQASGNSKSKSGSAAPNGVALGEAAIALTFSHDALQLTPEGYHIEYGGQFESEQAASRVLALTSFMSIVIIFLLLYHEFRSVKESGVILLNLPLALIGGVFALVITTGEVSIPAIIGFISLFGIATRNGMLLISHYNHLQQVEGLNVYDSVIQGSLDRLNPILMTALSSALALIPLALGGDLPGNEIQSPMAKVILGGLLTSTFLNGFIVPIVYLMMHRQRSAGANSPCGVPAEQA